MAFDTGEPNNDRLTAMIATIAAEHTAAMQRLTQEQQRAIARLGQAKRLTHFKGGTTAENLPGLFVIEAANRETGADGKAILPADIEAEHTAAMQSLTREQQWAIWRMQQAKQLTHFKGGDLAVNLQRVIAAEAEKRLKAMDERTPTGDALPTTLVSEGNRRTLEPDAALGAAL